MSEYDYTLRHKPGYNKPETGHFKSNKAPEENLFKPVKNGENESFFRVKPSDNNGNGLSINGLEEVQEPHSQKPAELSEEVGKSLKNMFDTISKYFENFDTNELREALIKEERNSFGYLTSHKPKE